MSFFYFIISPTVIAVLVQKDNNWCFVSMWENEGIQKEMFKLLDILLAFLQVLHRQIASLNYETNFS